MSKRKLLMKNIIFLFICALAFNISNVFASGSGSSGHVHRAGDWTTSVAATCANGGTEVRKCTSCGEIVRTRYTDKNPNNHTNMHWETSGVNDNTGKHKKFCDGCNKIEVDWTYHSYGENHSCSGGCGATYKWGADHRFNKYGGKCQAYECECPETLTATVSFSANLPKEEEYKMIDASTDYLHVKLNFINVNFNHIPYISTPDGKGTDGTLELSKVKASWRSFTHGNYNEHLAAISGRLINSGVHNSTIGSYYDLKADNEELAVVGPINDGPYYSMTYNSPAVADIDKPLGEWSTGLFGKMATLLYNGNGELYPDTGAGTATYRIPTESLAGHGAITAVNVDWGGSKAILDDVYLYANGTCTSKGVDIYGHLNVAYRTVNGEAFEGLEDYLYRLSVRGPNKATSINIVLEHGIPDIAGYRYVGYAINSGTLGIAGPGSIENREYLSNVSVPMSFSTSGINKSITFYYEKVKLTIRHFNITDGTTEGNGLRQITTNNILTREDKPGYTAATFNTDPAGTVPLHTSYPDYPTNSLSKFWWPAYNLEYATISTEDKVTNDFIDMSSGGQQFRQINFHPYIVFAPKKTTEAECSNIVNSKNIKNAIKEIYDIDSDVTIDIIDRMVSDGQIDAAKSALGSAANILVYARKDWVSFVESVGSNDFYSNNNVNLTTTKSIASRLEDYLLSSGDKAQLIKKTVTVPYARAVSEAPANRADKFINYYYTTTEIMVKNVEVQDDIEAPTKYMQSKLGHDLITKVPIRDAAFRAESLITTPPHIPEGETEGYYYYSVYNPDTNVYLREKYNISGYILTGFDVKIGDEVIFELTKEDIERDFDDVELYPPFTEQFIVDTSFEPKNRLEDVIKNSILQLDLESVDKNASVNFYYKDVSLLTVKYLRTIDNEEIHSSKTIILSGDSILVDKEDITNYEYQKYTLDGVDGGPNQPPVLVSPGANGADRILIFYYGLPELEVATPQNNEQYVDLRSNRRQDASQIQQQQYPSASPRLDGGKYSNTYQDLEEYNTYNDAERWDHQTNEGIPTSEDLYANVVAKQFLMDNALSMQPTKQKMELTIVKKYYETNKTDGGTQYTDLVKIHTENVTDIEVPYQYFGASGADLKIIENAYVYNNVINEINEINGNKDYTKLDPTYDKPSMEYTKNGYIYLPGKPDYDTTLTNLPVDSNGNIKYKELESGFYEVDNPDNKDDVFKAVWVLEGIDEYKPDDGKLRNEYQSANGLILTALQVAGAKVKPDKLLVNYNYNYNGQGDSGKAIFKVVSDDKYMDLGKVYTMDELKNLGILNTDKIPLTGTDVLYKNKNLFVDSTSTNGTHGVSEVMNLNVSNSYKNNTVAEVNYVLYQIIEREVVKNVYKLAEYADRANESNQTQTIVGYPVVVHTPVVNPSEFNLEGGSDKDNYSKANNHTVNDITGTNGTIVLGQKFDLKFPNKGVHIENAKGYHLNLNTTVNKDYNYDGLLANGQEVLNGNQMKDKSKFAAKKQVRFSDVGVILYSEDISENLSGGTYYKPNTWIDLDLAKEKYTFIIPEWEEEVWEDNRQIIVETRVYAENMPDTSIENIGDDTKGYYRYWDNTSTSNSIEEDYNAQNRLKSEYGVWHKFGFKVIGELKDLEIRATNDPGFSQYKNQGTSELPIGQFGQANGGEAYKYGLKLGYSVYFDITSTGWTGDTTESVKLTPRYYYVSKNGGNAKPVDLYYKVVGNKDYIKLYGAKNKAGEVPRTLSTILKLDSPRGIACKSVYTKWATALTRYADGLFKNGAASELSVTNGLITSLVSAGNNYLHDKGKNPIPLDRQQTTGNTSLVVLPYTVRLAYSYATNAINITPTGKYGNVSGLDSIPKNIRDYCVGHWYGVFKIPATTVAVDPEVTPTPNKSNTLKDGYIIVTFEDVHSEVLDGTDYLKVGPDRYKQENADTQFTLPNGNLGNIPSDPVTGIGYIPAVIYETNIAANQDAEIGGTH